MIDPSLAKGTMNQRTMRVGIVGAGLVTTGSHLPALGGLPDVSVEWICDRSAAAAERAAAKYGVSDVQTDMDACRDVDVVLLATPVGTRRVLIPQALERGWHVFCEKPFALTTADHDQFVALAAARGLRLGVGQVRRFAGPTATARAIVASGIFGDIQRLSAFEGTEVRNTGRGAEWYLTDTSQQTGVLLETGSHLVDQLLYITDARDSEVTAVRRVERRSIELESQVEATVRLPDGRAVPALVGLSMLHDMCNGIFVEFDKALLHVGLFFGDKLRLITAEGRQICAIEQSAGINDDAMAFSLEWLDFLGHVRTGSTSVVDAASVRRTTQFIHDAYTMAADIGVPV